MRVSLSIQLLDWKHCFSNTSFANVSQQFNVAASCLIIEILGEVWTLCCGRSVESSNVRTLRWLPQASLLAHPKTRLFISHCGLNAIFEAAHFGVPVLAIPLSADQHNHAAKVRASVTSSSSSSSSFILSKFCQHVAKTERVGLHKY